MIIDNNIVQIECDNGVIVNMCCEIYNKCLDNNHIKCSFINDDPNRGRNNRLEDCFIITYKNKKDFNFCYLQNNCNIGYFNSDQILKDTDILIKKYDSTFKIKSKIYYSERDINKIKDLLNVYYSKNEVYITNYIKINDSRFNDLTERILLCYILNFHKDLLIKTSQFSDDFINYLESCWVESNDDKYGPDIVFKNKLTHKIMLYGDVECYKNNKKQLVYDRKLKTKRQTYYIEGGYNENLNDVYVFRFLYDFNNGLINKLICYNIADLVELVPVKSNNNDDPCSILDETHYINIDLTDINIKRRLLILDNNCNMGIEQILINNQILRSSDQNIKFKIIKTGESDEISRY